MLQPALKGDIMTRRALPLISCGIAILALASLGAKSHSIELDAAAGNELMHPSIRDRFLRALTTGPVEAGKIRIAIPTDGATYEVIVAAPGEPRLIHAQGAGRMGPS